MGNLIRVIMALAGIVNWFMPMTMAIDPQCDFYQYVVPGQSYYIYNLEYPDLYRGVVSCRWRAESPPDSRIMLTCEDISLPPGPDCPTDRLSVSRTGNSNLVDAHNYCGYGQLTLMSDQNLLAVGLFSSSVTRGGRFLCTITAVYNDNGGGGESPNNCDCGKRQERRIVGGVDASVNEFPSMIALVDYSATEPFCGGTVINSKYVLSAAHCVFQKRESLVSVVVGLHSTEITASSTRYGVQRFVMHPQFNSVTYQNDIVLIRTTTDIIFTSTVSPVCLPIRYSDRSFTGYNVIAIGWGTTYFTGPRPDVLQKANLTVISNTECSSSIDDTITPTNMCTFTPDKDACQFDSGGPLMWFNPENNRLYITGIISSGVACNTDNPGINTRITSFLDWIATQTEDVAYCVK